MKQITELRPDCGQFKFPIQVLQQISKESKLLDVGADIGLLNDFLPNNIHYTSLDITKNSDISHDLDKFPIPIKNDSYDIIVSLETLEHTLYPDKVMEELKRIAKPNALFLVSMPNEYNFWCRINFLFGRKTMVQEPFKVVEKHLHIQLPRVKDIIKFYSNSLNVEKVNYEWYSHTSSKTNNVLIKLIDRSINTMAKINPSLFARCVVIKGVVKQN